MIHVPTASSSGVSARMSRQATRETAPEVGIRLALHGRGYRYRVHYPVPGATRRRIDIAFPRRRVAVFVDGCFWHGCRDHRTIPRANHTWWRAKLAENADRDRETARLLEEDGWTVIRVWEHEAVLEAVDRIAVELDARVAAHHG